VMSVFLLLERLDILMLRVRAKFEVEQITGRDSRAELRKKKYAGPKQ